MKYKYNYGNNQRKYSKKNIIFLAVFIFISFIISLFLFRENAIVSSIGDALLTPFKAISGLKINENVSDYFSSKASLEAENKKLKEKSAEVSLRLLEYEKLLKENQSLRKMLDISSSFQHYDLVLSRIIIRSHDSYNMTFVIDVGEDDKIEKGQAVVHENGLVGYISEVSKTSSVVTTILDPKTSVSVILPTISKPALLTGTLEMKSQNNLKLESIEMESEVSIGDIAYTSGLGNMYPKAIPVASVIKVESKKTESERYATCMPLVDINSIDEVAVIIGEK